MITLFHAPKSRSSRMIWLLEELGQPYAIEQVSIFRPMDGSGAPDPKNPHPEGKVPAISDDGVPISETLAITLYLTDAYPKAGLGVPVGDRRRGTYLTWLAWYVGEFEPAMFAAFTGELERNPNRKRAYDQAMERVEKALAAGPYLMGEHFTAVDVLLASAAAWARKMLPESAALDAYVERCTQREAAVRAASKDDAQGVQLE